MLPFCTSFFDSFPPPSMFFLPSPPHVGLYNQKPFFIAFYSLHAPPKDEFVVTYWLPIPAGFSNPLLDVFSMTHPVNQISCATRFFLFFFFVFCVFDDYIRTLLTIFFHALLSYHFHPLYPPRPSTYSFISFAAQPPYFMFLPTPLPAHHSFAHLHSLNSTRL